MPHCTFHGCSELCSQRVVYVDQSMFGSGRWLRVSTKMSALTLKPFLRNLSCQIPQVLDLSFRGYVLVTEPHCHQRFGSTVAALPGWFPLRITSSLNRSPTRELHVPGILFCMLRSGLLIL
eukprot:4900462-Amphidinium_carterae.1